MSEYGLIVSFPDQSEAFTLGFEAGMFWQRLESGERYFQTMAHIANGEVLSRMVDARGLRMECELSGVDGWIVVRVDGPHVKRPHLTLVQGGLREDT